MNIDKLESGIGWWFDPDHFSLFSNGFLNIFDFTHIDKLNGNSIFFFWKNSKISLCSSINIVAYNNVISSLENMHYGCSSSTSTSKSNGLLSILDSGKTFFQCLSCWVSSSRIIKFSVRLCDISLGVSWSEVNWDIDTTVNWLWLLPLMNGNSWKSLMLNGEVLFQSEFLILYIFFLCFFVQHYDMIIIY